jgi:hypothetical protein
MIVVVLPESPSFTRELIMDQTRHKLESIIAEARGRAPGAIWVRLDRAPELLSDTNFWDLVHLNAPGQAAATRSPLSQLDAAGVIR